ncbi:GTP cyclohydrolase I [Amycolatopsis nigrescens]|uniref:GTP cyclohydrolase I n=1 Tax=Amycolatopsis nigrescens TaxID=381445 RepID=UPI0003AAC2B2|nr:GTP cyclohydrolase I [Amycolatopsis nigrescens]
MIPDSRQGLDIPGQRQPGDLKKAELGVRDLLQVLDARPAGAQTAETAEALVALLSDFLKPQPFAPALSPSGEQDECLTLVQSIQFTSLCSCHLLPFFGFAHVGYIPGGWSIDVPELVGTVRHFARNAQTQEYLTGQIARGVEEMLHAGGVGVVVSATHLCACLRGEQSAGAELVTSCLLGSLRSDPRTRAEFLSLLDEHDVRSGGRS